MVKGGMVDTHGRYKKTRQIATPVLVGSNFRPIFANIPHSGMWIKCQIADYVPLMQ